MSQSNLMMQLLKRLEDGSNAIRERYESLAKASDAAYRGKIEQVERDYAEAANAASAAAKINLKNSLEKMADAGYYRSGETVQATIAAGADHSRSLAALAVQKAKDKKEYESEMANARANLSLQGEKEAMDFENSLSERILEQENADRVFEAEERQRKTENEISRQQLLLEEKKISQGEEKEKSEALVPSKDPYTYFNEIVKKYTKTPKGKNYKIIDRKAVRLALSAIVKDRTISYRYRYEMFLYAKSMGYA